MHVEVSLFDSEITRRPTSVVYMDAATLASIQHCIACWRCCVAALRKADRITQGERGWVGLLLCHFLAPGRSSRSTSGIRHKPYNRRRVENEKWRAHTDTHTITKHGQLCTVIGTRRWHTATRSLQLLRHRVVEVLNK